MGGDQYIKPGALGPWRVLVGGVADKKEKELSIVLKMENCTMDIRRNGANLRGVASKSVDGGREGERES